MANEKLQYEVTFKTRAEGDGAQKTAAAVRNLRDETARLNGLSTVEKLGATEFAYYDLGAEIDRTKAKVASFTATTNTAAVAKGKFGQIAGQAGFQVQDFAVQVGAGQNAMVAFAQQGSQLLGMFGPGGAVAGALLAVGAIAYNTFSKMKDDVSSVLPQGDTLKKLLDDIAANAERASAEEIDYALGAMKAATDQAAELRDRWNETNAAADAYEATQLDNQEKIRQAFVEWRKLRGEQIDELAEIQAREDAAAAKRLLDSQQADEAARKKAEAAAKAAEDAQKELVTTAGLSAAKQIELQQENAKLEFLRGQRDVLQEIADKGYFEVTAQDVAALGMAPGTTSNQARDEAARRGREDIAPQLAKLKGEIAALEASLASSGEITSAVIAAAATASTTAVAAADAAAAMDFEIAKISETLGAEDLVGKVSEASQLATATADEIKLAIPKLQTVGADQVAAKESLTLLASDGKITAAEMAQALRDLQTLFNGNSEQVTKMISFMKSANEKIDQQDREISRALLKMEGMKGR